ncbi:MAG: hypothetical protein SCM11_04520 [Bacillota bacterium]|nr:hypothetical protein [Bacillota bacterium]
MKTSSVKHIVKCLTRPAAIALVMFCLVLAMLAALVEPAAADMGPKPQITIIIKNAPEDTYYLDLLVQGNKTSKNIHDPQQYDQDKLKLLEEYEADGWHAALAGGTGMPLFGKLTGEERGSDQVHTFSYFGTPDQFKIIIVTPDNELKISRELMRQSFHMTLTYDYATGSINQRPLALSYLLQFISTLLPTLLLEGLILLLFGFSLRLNLRPFLLVNLATQIMLTASLGTVAIMSGMFTAYLLLVPLEFIIIILEAVGYAFWLKQHGKGRRITYAIVANLVSAFAGIVAMSFLFA